MTPTLNKAGVIILDVFNLRGSHGEISDQPFRICDFDNYVQAIQLAIPEAVLIGVLDGSASDTNRTHDFGSPSDQAELMQRTRLPQTDPQYIYLLPPQRTDRKWDNQYLHADPVCIHLLREFQPMSALVTHDGLNKDGDFRHLSIDDPLRESIFRPWWAKSEKTWVFVSRRQLDSTWSFVRRRRVENREIQRLEDFFKKHAIAESDHDDIRERAFGLVHDFVNEFRASAGTQGKRRTSFGGTSKRKSFFDMLRPEDFEDQPQEPVKTPDEVLIEPSLLEDTDVKVQILTEDIDLIGSISELKQYVGRHVRVDAMLNFDHEIAYLTWLGTSDRVRVIFDDPSIQISSGFVRIEGLLSDDRDYLMISVDRQSHIAYASVTEVVSSRVKRMVNHNLFKRSEVGWSFPALPIQIATQEDTDNRDIESVKGSTNRLETSTKPPDGDVGEEERQQREQEARRKNLEEEARRKNLEEEERRKNLEEEERRKNLEKEERQEREQEARFKRREFVRKLFIAVAVIVLVLAAAFAVRTFALADDRPNPDICLEPPSLGCGPAFNISVGLVGLPIESGD